MSNEIHDSILKYNAMDLDLTKGCNGSRDSGSIKMNIFCQELKEKPIKYWANCNEPKDSELNKITSTLLAINGVSFNNNIHHLSYYQGAKFSCPYLLILNNDDSFEMIVYRIDGEGNDSLRFKRSLTENEYFTDEEIENISKFVKYHSDAIRSAYTSRLWIDKHGYNKVDKIIQTLSNRKGFDSWWCDIDSEIKEEIIKELQDSI